MAKDKGRDGRTAAGNKVEVGNIQGAGEINIAGGDVYKGYSVEQVSTLIREISVTFQPKAFEGRSPYKGLDYFEESDADLFFGREKWVKTLVSKLGDERTLFVTGPSGSGKSSLVRAGLIHALKGGCIKNSERWLYGTMKPGRDPIAELARVTARLAKSTNAENEINAQAAVDPTIFRRWCEMALGDGKDERVVFFIDQFEEAFTQINRETASTFIDLLADAANTENGRILLLFAMRSDFVANCATYPKLNALLNRQFVQIGAMQADELVSAIAQPALRVGLRIDPDLIAQIINDMQGEPGALPLMQFALKDLFDAELARGGIIALTLEEYLQRGGIRKALERHADESFRQLEEHEQELARSIFSGLIEIGRGTQDTRRTAIFDELIPANTKSEEVENIIRKLADARLVTTDEVAGRDTVTISHEKLIEAWPWLKKLVDENRDVIALQNEIAKDAKEWEEHRRDTSYLYSGARLGIAQEQLDAHRILLSGLAKEFVEAGIALQAVERKARETLRRRITLGLIAGLMIALGLAGFAVYQLRQAQKQTTIAQKQAQFARGGELSAQAVALRDQKTQLSLLLGIEGYRTVATFQSLAAVLDNTRAHPHLSGYLNGHTGEVSSVTFSPDGTTLASVGIDGTAILWDIKTGKPIGPPLAARILSLAFSLDGKTITSGNDDGSTTRWDMKTSQPISRSSAWESDRWIHSLALSTNGERIAYSLGDYSALIIRDLRSGKSINQSLTEQKESTDIITFSPDSRILASNNGRGTIILWDANSGEPIGQPLTGQTYDWITSLVFSPDGKILASGSQDGSISLWDVATGQPINQPLTGHTNGVSALAFSPDGVTLASGSSDRTVLLWDVGTGQPISKPLIGHSEVITSVAFHPDGKNLASAGTDGTIILWDILTLLDAGVREDPPIGWLIGQDTGVVGAAFSPDGKILASGGNYGTITLLEVETGRPIGELISTNRLASLAFNPTGEVLASGSCSNLKCDDFLYAVCECGLVEVTLWDIRTHESIRPPLLIDMVFSLAFSPDSSILASSDYNGDIFFWDLETGDPIGKPLSNPESVDSMAFSPDGKMLASGNWWYTVILWDVETGRQIGEPLEGNTIRIASVAISPDGRTIASGSDDGIIILWDVETGQPIGKPLIGHTNGVNSVMFSPDGKILASGSDDRTIILWDVATGQPIGQPLTGHMDTVTGVAFSPDGKSLASGSLDGTVILWNLDPQAWIEMTCQRVGRNLTRAEWEQYLPGEEYRKTCEQFSLEP